MMVDPAPEWAEVTALDKQKLLREMFEAVKPEQERVFTI
jgi:hypothetical protein